MISHEHQQDIKILFLEKINNRSTMLIKRMKNGKNNKNLSTLLELSKKYGDMFDQTFNNL